MFEYGLHMCCVACCLKVVGTTVALFVVVFEHQKSISTCLCVEYNVNVRIWIVYVLCGIVLLLKL